MRRQFQALSLLLVTMFPADLSADALDEGRRLTALFYAGDVDAVWGQMNAEMRSALGDAPALEAFAGQVEAQLGKEAAVMDESVIPAPGYEVYLRTARFEKFDGLIHVQWAFDAQGKVGGFFVRPVQQAAGTKHLDYQTKTALRLPFDGPWFVFWGGRTIRENYHAAVQDQRFAYDFVQTEGGTSHAGDGSTNDQYYCWEEPIRAPGAGSVVAAVDGVDDNVPGIMNPSQPVGNHVILDHGNGEFSFLAHFKKGTVKVEQGSRVASGDLLGLCGNSGNSSEPHLHYHLQTTAVFSQGEGLPAQFERYLADGKAVARGEPVRGQTIEAATESTGTTLEIAPREYSAHASSARSR